MRTLVLLVSLAGLGLVLPAEAQRGFPRQRVVPAFALWSPLNGDNLYTNNSDEIDSASPTYDYVGIAFYMAPRPGPGLVPLYRFARFVGDDAYVHALATSSTAGRQLGMRGEGVIGYISRNPRQGLRALNAWYNPDEGTYLYATLPARDTPPREGYEFVGVVGYVVPGRMGAP